MRKLFYSLLMVLLALSIKASDDQVRMMVHLLDYIAVDYNMAVENGKIINQAEYQEMQEFGNTISSLGQSAPNQVQSRYYSAQ